MSKAIGAGIVIVAVLAIAFMAGGLNIITPPPSESMIVTITVTDGYSSTVIPDTSDIYIYVYEGGYLSPRDAKLDLTSGDVDTVRSYTTGETLMIKVVDPTDLSYGTVYYSWTVPSPSASEIEAGKFKCDLNVLNMDDVGNDDTMDWDPAWETNAGTAIAADAIKDVTTESWNTNYAYLNCYIYNDDDDTGYINSWNFEDDLKNNAYFFVDVSGTGWDSFAVRSGATASFSRNNHLYLMVPLSNDALSRDLDPGLGFVGDRDGVHKIGFTYDLTGFEAGDNVTISYGIRFYADWDNFVNLGSWGVDSVEIAETIYIQY